MQQQRQGLMPLYSNTLMSLKLSLRVVSANANNVYSEGYYVEHLPKNSWLKHQNCACQGLRTPFSNTFLSLRSAQRGVHKI